MIKSMYIHIPFCNSICSYCDFPKVYYNKDYIIKYLDNLKEEINNNYKGEVLDTLYIGGGTPSSLSIDETEYLLNILDKINKSNNIEYTIECNFDSITYNKLDLYKKHNINRISFGLESINKNNLLFLERKLDKNKVKDIIKYCKEINLSNINIDLMYALPSETLEVLKEDIDFILSLDIPHISTYSLIIEDHTKLKINNIKNIDQDLDYKMYMYICRILKEANYNHYEISNFSKNNYASIHNKTYWYNNEYYGFGLGAASYINNVRSKNTSSLTKYLKGDNTKEKEHLSIKDKIEYEVILNLRLKEGINLDRFYKRYNKRLEDIYNYNDLVKNKLLVKNKNNINIPEDKWYISNEIIVRLLGSDKNEL